MNGLSMAVSSATLVCAVAANGGAAEVLPGSIEIGLEPIFNTFDIGIDAVSAPIDAGAAGDGNIYVASVTGQVIVGSSGHQALFLDLTASADVDFTASFAGGLMGIAFHPGYLDPESPGYHKFYTYSSDLKTVGQVGALNIAPGAELTGIPDFWHPEMFAPAVSGNPLTNWTNPDAVSPGNTDFDHFNVVREWTANTDGSAIDMAIGPREILRMAHGFASKGSHNGGGLRFGPDGYLYLSTGDGGGNSGQDHDGGIFNGDDGHTDGSGNAQDLSVVYGKVLRIDPTATIKNGANGQYGIPGDNPFVGDPQHRNALAEVYANGFRNPWKLAFDDAPGGDGALYLANVGQHHREEVDRIVKGGNYGWGYLEGSVRLVTEDAATGAADPSDLIDGTNGTPVRVPQGGFEAFEAATVPPFVDYLTRRQTVDGVLVGDGTAVTGGYVYRGSAVPELYGMYVFGDYSVGATPPDGVPPNRGRLFYVDPASPEIIFEFQIAFGAELMELLLGFGRDDAGELYALFDNGNVTRIVASAGARPGDPGATLYWDTDGLEPGLGSSSPETDWLTHSWSTAADGRGPALAWPNAMLDNDDRAIFSGTPGTVRVNDSVFVHRLEFGAPGYRLDSAGGVIHLVGHDAGIDVALPSGVVTVAAPLAGSDGLRLTGSSGDGSLEFLVLANTDAGHPNAFSGTLTIAEGGALRLGGGAMNEQLPDSVDVEVAGVIDFVTTGGASNGKREKVRDVSVRGPLSNFSVGNGTTFEVNSLRASATSGAGVAVNGNAASVPGRLNITGWADGEANLTLEDGLLRVNTTGATAAIGGRISLRGSLISRGNSEVSNKNGGGLDPETNRFDNRAFDFAGPVHTIDVDSGVLRFTSVSQSSPLEINTTNLEGTTLIKTGSGVWSWENAVEGSFTGVHRIEAGVWRLAGPARWSEHVRLEVLGGWVDLQGVPQSIEGILLAGGAIDGTSALASSTDINAESGSVGVALEGEVSVIKSTAASVRLSGVNRYHGATTIREGLLQVDGTNLEGGEFIVGSAGVLGGSGVIEAAIGVDGSVAPGAGVGTLGVGDVEFRAGSRLSVELIGAEADLLNAAAVSIASSARLEVSLLGPVAEGTYVVARYASRTGEFALDAPPGFAVSYDDAARVLLLHVGPQAQ